MTKKIIFSLTLVIISLVPLGVLTRIQLTPTTAVYIHDVLLSFLSGVIGCYWLRHRNISIWRNRLLRATGIFIGIDALSLLAAAASLPHNELVESSLYLLRFIAYASVYPGVLLLPSHQKKILIRVLIGAGAIFAVMGLVQYIWYPNLRNLLYQGWDPHLYRLFSTFLDPNFAGILLVLTLLLIIVHQKKYFNRTFLALGLLLFVSLLLTYSRSSFIAFLSGLIVVGLGRKQYRLIGGLGILFILSMVLLPRPFGEGVRLERTVSASARIGSWEEGLAVFIQHPLLGVGFNTYRYRRMISEDYPPMPSHAAAGIDNSWLFVLATTGLIGFGAYILIWFRFVTAELYSHIPFNRLIRLSSFTAVGVHALFQNTLFFPAVMVWLWTLAGATEEQL